VPGGSSRSTIWRSGVTRRATLELYRVRWNLTDLALGASLLCGPHLGTEDDEKSWADLRALVDGLM
jgi:hypothetical protein